jgi:hypothetical protein
VGRGTAVQLRRLAVRQCLLVVPETTWSTVSLQLDRRRSRTACAPTLGTFPASNEVVFASSGLTYYSSSIYTGTAQAPFSICNSFLMYENDRDTNPKVGLGCGKSSKVWNYYRTPPAIATPGPSSSTFILPLCISPY